MYPNRPDREISDLHTCLKLLPTALFRELLVTELTAVMLAWSVRTYEVPIACEAHSREEGKELTWGDGVVATKILIRVRLRKGDHRPPFPPAQPLAT